MSRFSTVAAFDETFRADVARSVLEDAGIAVRIADREIVAMEWILSGAVGGIKVQVAEADAIRARQLLDETFHDLRENGIDEEELAQQALAAVPEADVPPPPPVAEQGATAEHSRQTANKGEREQYALRFLRASAFGAIFLPFSFCAFYLGLNALFGAGRLSSEGWRRVLYGLFLLAFLTFPFWWFVLAIGGWGLIEALTPG